MLTTKDGIPLPRSIEMEVLKSVKVLLVFTSEFSVMWNYLEPLNGYKHIHRYNQIGHQTQIITYYIGKYGACHAAIIKISPVFEPNNTSTIVMMADQCFPNLDAVISVGVVCGIKKKAQICDVLVSSKVINYIYDITTKEYIQKGEAITLSNAVVKLFAQPVQWPSELGKKYLEVNRQQIPDVKCGMILSGPYVVDDPAINEMVKKFAVEAIGIEMDGANIFANNQKATVNTIIVKAVCDFGDGKDIKVNQNTAALLASDLVYIGLSHPQASEILKGLSTYS